MARRDDLQRMLQFRKDQHPAGEPIDGIPCYDTSRFSRADSNEPAHAIWEFRQAGANRQFTR